MSTFSENYLNESYLPSCQQSVRSSESLKHLYSAAPCCPTAALLAARCCPTVGPPAAPLVHAAYCPIPTCSHTCSSLLLH